jgi:hypothetical protein
VIIKCPTGSKSDFDKEVENTKKVRRGLVFYHPIEPSYFVKVDASGVFPVKLFVDSGVGILDCDETKPLNCLVLTDLTKHGFTELSKAAQAKGKGAECSKLMDNALGASEKNIIQLASKKIGHGDLDTTNTFTNADGSDTIFIDWPDLEVSAVFCVLQLRYRLRFFAGPRQLWRRGNTPECDTDNIRSREGETLLRGRRSEFHGILIQCTYLDTWGIWISGLNTTPIIVFYVETCTLWD